MDVGTAILLLFLGSFLTIAGDALRKTWAAETERSRRRDERAEEAATSLFRALDELQESFRPIHQPGYEPEDLGLQLRDLRRHAAMLSDDSARRLFGRIASVTFLTEATVLMKRETPSSAIAKVCEVGRDALGCLLRLEPLKVDESFLVGFEAAVQEMEEDWERMEAEHMAAVAAEEEVGKETPG